MFLKSLDIIGFKSFADRTRIEFSGGITALLGPNGCGKSNVVDAIKWVLGEQASRAMRAEKMEDVIFNGTENRKALGMAEVSLTLVNEAGLLPLDMPEIQIKRRLYRSGESEYFINQAPVKLKDIRELFWDTGVGKAAYSVMEQGKIDQVLSSKPDERRYLFEEAAGITRYKVRSADAERKLLRTEENMRQVAGILAEVKRSYENLKIQADKTIKYRSLRDEIFNFELDIQLLRLKQFKGDRENRGEELARLSLKRDEIKETIDGINRSLEENMDLVNSMEGALVEHQRLIYGLAVEKNAKEKEARLVAEQRSQSKEKIERDEERHRQIQRKIEELLDDATEQEGEVLSLQKRVAEIQDNIKNFEENIETASSQIGENDRLAGKAEQEISRCDQERLVLEKDLEAITDSIVTELDARLKDAGYSASERARTENELHEVLGRLKTILEGRSHLLTDFQDLARRFSEANSPINPKDLLRLSTSLSESISEAVAHSQSAIALFTAYCAQSPSFLDEFLAPEGIITQKRTIDRKIRENKNEVQREREKIGALRVENEGLMGKIDEYRKTLEDLRVSRVRMSTQSQAAEEQARLIRRELAGQENQLKILDDEIFLENKKLQELNEHLEEAEGEIAEIEFRGTTLTKELEELEKNIAKKNGDLAGKKEKIQKSMAELAKVQEQLERLHISIVQSDTEITSIQENFRDTHSRDLLEFEERMFQITASSGELREKLAASRQAFKELGSVNLMAPEEFAETKERYDFLNNQLEDLQKARDDLEHITAEIRAESSDLFMASYNKIKKNFHNMFRRLFGGGRAELRLSDPYHVLESGIEIFAQPPGKKLENITQLSGGEKSMTAVALLFATYMVKPSPFCLLNEIEAALDETNVLRFVQVLREFGASSQFIVITHNKKTVTGAQTLLGVTMEEFGVTKVVSVRLENDAEKTLEKLADSEDFVEEDVEPETGLSLPLDVEDPKKVRPEDLRPIRALKQNNRQEAVQEKSLEEIEQ